MKNCPVLILDFGSQYTQLIARSVRSLNIYCEIHPCNVPASVILELYPQAIILSGSPCSVTAVNAPMPSPIIWNLNVPVLGICYGMQLTAKVFAGKVSPAEKKEYGHAELHPAIEHPLFSGLLSSETVWMSHGDSVTALPTGFKSIASTSNSPYAAIANDARQIFALQFHPEVAHTPNGKQIISNFLIAIAGLNADWTPASFVQQTIFALRERIGDKKVILGLSGGVDSSVAAALLHRAIGKNLLPVFVDTGLLRKHEATKVRQMFSVLSDFEFETIDAGELFLDRLKGVDDPEQKRKIIGATFIEVFEQAAARHPEAEFLAQGTLYPDVIESVSFKGPSVTIKSHHNVGGLPVKMQLKLVEPLRELFKDEVRMVGRELGLPDELVNRHPFPGPGLAVRILGDITPERADLLREIDDIFISELYSNNLYHTTWQAFAVLLPIRSVGVMGDERTYDNVCALRAVNSVDGMTADWTELPWDFLKRVSNRIINEVKGVNRVVYDISSKPPATIEWE